MIHAAFWIFAALYLLITLNLHSAAKDEFHSWFNHEKRNSPVVFGNLSGKRYHTSSHSVGYIRTSVFEASRAGLTPCQVCKPPYKNHTKEQMKRREPSYFWYGSFLSCAGLFYILLVSVKIPEEEMIKK